jgi:hypothetical protein
MRIAALYITQGHLPHLFGKDHAELTVNLGGQYIYTVNDSTITEVSINPYFLEDVFGDEISLFSCIVGNNGGGKTSLLKLLTSDWHCMYVVEKDVDDAGEDHYWLTDNPERFHRIYYTPYLNDAAFSSVRTNGKDLLSIV